MAQCPVPAVPQQPVLIMRADRLTLTADELADLKRRFEAVLTKPTVRTVTIPGLIA